MVTHCVFMFSRTKRISLLIGTTLPHLIKLGGLEKKGEFCDRPLSSNNISEDSRYIRYFRYNIMRFADRFISCCNNFKNNLLLQ